MPYGPVYDAQSIISCSESFTSPWPRRNHCASMSAVAENWAHVPHRPCEMGGFTAPRLTQSIGPASRMEASSNGSRRSVPTVSIGPPRRPESSLAVQSAVQSSSKRACGFAWLDVSTASFARSQIPSREASSATVA